REKQAGGERGSSNVGEAVAEQNGADQPFADRQQVVDDPGATIAATLECVHARARRRGQSRLGTRKKGGEDQETEDSAKGDAQARDHRLHSRARNALKACMGTSRSTYACPIPRASTSASLPPFTFLSWAMSLSSSSGVGEVPGISAMESGKPTSARCRST